MESFLHDYPGPGGTRYVDATAPHLPFADGQFDLALSSQVRFFGRRIKEAEVTKESFENAVASVAATGGSTNAVLHLVAIARDFGIDFTIDDFERVSARTPIVADMKPWGRWNANDMYAAGGVALVARELGKAGLLHEDARTVDGRTFGEIADGAEETDGQTVVVPIETPLKARGGVTTLDDTAAAVVGLVVAAHHLALRASPDLAPVARGGDRGRARARFHRAATRRAVGPPDERKSRRRSHAEGWRPASARASPNPASE